MGRAPRRASEPIDISSARRAIRAVEDSSDPEVWDAALESASAMTRTRMLHAMTVGPSATVASVQHALTRCHGREAQRLFGSKPTPSLVGVDDWVLSDLIQAGGPAAACAREEENFRRLEALGIARGNKSAAAMLSASTPMWHTLTVDDMRVQIALLRHPNR